MSILIDERTRILVQGITGSQARADIERAIAYGSHIVAGVTPGKGGEVVHGVPVYDTVAGALEHHDIDASIVYAPPLRAMEATLEASQAKIPLLLITAEGVPSHDIAIMIASARQAGLTLIGCNTNGIISPGKSRLGGIGGGDPDQIYMAGDIGICSRSGGMSAEIALALHTGGLGVSTCVSMGGDSVTGTSMATIVRMFEDDPETSAIVIFGEPGTTNEIEVAELVAAGAVKKPVVALIVGAFQERYPRGQSFGHAAAIVTSSKDTVSEKKKALRAANVFVAETLDKIPAFLKTAAGAP